jgi:hypothetical protein
VALTKDWRSAYSFVVGRPEGKVPIERPRCRWEDNIKWIFKMWDGEAFTGFMWFRIGTGSGHF